MVYEPVFFLIIIWQLHTVLQGNPGAQDETPAHGLCQGGLSPQGLQGRAAGCLQSGNVSLCSYCGLICAGLEGERPARLTRGEADRDTYRRSAVPREYRRVDLVLGWSRRILPCLGLGP